MILRRNFMFFWIYVILLTGVSIWSFNLPIDSCLALKWLGGICLIELVLFFIFNTKFNRKFLNYSVVFVVVLYVFNFGQLQINTFFSNIYPHVRFLLLMSPEAALYGFQWINLSFNVICIGICLMSSISCKLTLRDKKYEQVDYALVAKRIIMLTFPIKFFIDVACVYVSITSGGVAARVWLNEFPNVLVFLGKISLIGFALLIVQLKRQPAKQLRIFVFIEVYILTMMLSGIRSENVGYVLIFILVYLLSKQKKGKIFRYILCFIIFIPVLAFIIAVGEFRTVTDKSMDSFLQIFNQSLTEKNVILSLFDTCGDTGYTALCVLTKWLPKYSPSYGSSYAGGLFAILPNIPPYFTLPGDITRETCFALKLQEYGTLYSYYTNIGGSLIGESFFNFGLFGGAVFSLIIGLFIGRINQKFLVGLDGQFYELIWTIPFMFASVYWVRDYFGHGVREAVWGYLFVYFVLKYSIEKRKKCVYGKIY